LVPVTEGIRVVRSSSRWPGAPHAAGDDDA